jgi:hypothetical protein
MTLIPEGHAKELIRDRRRCLARMNTRHGPKRFIVPGGEVSDETAAKIRGMPQVVASNDGLFPGLNQTWRITGGCP